MKRRILSIVLGLALCASMALTASAAQVHEVPVTLTVINTQHRISVTVPASLPVSVVDGYVVTADNAAIRNTADDGTIRVSGVSVNDGALTVGDYDDFESSGGSSIALDINGCTTKGSGSLAITRDTFPDIEAGDSLKLDYNAKVNISGEQSGVSAATVIFTIEAVR